MSSHPTTNEETIRSHQHHQHHSDTNYIDHTAYNLFYYAPPNETKDIMEQAKRVEELDKELTKLKQLYHRYALSLPEKTSLRNRAGAWLRPSRSANSTPGSAHPSLHHPAMAEPFAQIAANGMKIQLDQTQGVYEQAAKSLDHQLRHFAQRAMTREQDRRDAHHTALTHTFIDTMRFDPDHIVRIGHVPGYVTRADRSHVTGFTSSTDRSRSRSTHGDEPNQGPDTSFGLVEEAQALAKDCSDSTDDQQALNIMRKHGAFSNKPIPHHGTPISPSALFGDHRYRLN